MSQRSWVRDVEDMHDKYGEGGLRRIVAGMSDDLLRELWSFRKRFIREELDELESAETADDAVDALVDMMVVIVGTLDMFGVDQRRAWDVVHRANMSKIPGANPSRPNPFGLPDLVKPEGWIPPSHADNVGLLSPVV